MVQPPRLLLLKQRQVAVTGVSKSPLNTRLGAVASAGKPAKARARPASPARAREKGRWIMGGAPAGCRFRPGVRPACVGA